MTPLCRVHVLPLALALGLAFLGCSRDTAGLKPVPPDTNPLVFDDDFTTGMDFQAFLGSKVDAVEIDNAESYAGTASLRVTVPGPGDPDGTYAGGAFTLARGRNFTVYNALVFYIKAERDVALDIAGFGNDNTGTSKYPAGRGEIPVTTEWTRQVIPIPRPSRLTDERGLFFFAEGYENNQGYVFWMDEIRFETVPGITNPRPRMPSRILSAFVGASVELGDVSTTFSVDGVDLEVGHAPGYFTFFSNRPEVATVAEGEIRAVGPGTATITAKLDTVDVSGSVTLNTIGVPTTAAPVPQEPAADVISLFSNAYPNIAVDTWSATWDVADLVELQVDGDDIKGYTNLSYAGIEFTSTQVDASEMAYFHIDVWAPSGIVFKVKLVDFGADGAFGGTGDDQDSEHELTLTSSSDPPFTPGGWVGLDIPLDSFTRLRSRAHLAQLILSGVSTAFVDNVYFHK